MTKNLEHCSPNKNFHALALTGGGYRGLFTARVLQRIEEKLEFPIGRCFDLVSGTSIGGIIALAVGFEVPMEKVVQVFKTRGPEIFPAAYRARRWSPLRAVHFFTNLIVPKYSAQPLQLAIEDLIPRKALLGSSAHALAIPSTNVTKGTLRVFKTPHTHQFFEDATRTVTEVALATSAAPTYFSLAESRGALYADGGLFANAPDLVAAHEADYAFGIAPDNLKILSIGTLSSEFSIPGIKNKDFGIANWMKDGRLIEIMISAQGQFTTQMMRHRFKENYIRLDEVVPHDGRKLELDNASDEMAAYLISRADKVADVFLERDLEKFRNHKPTTWKNNGKSQQSIS